jgi:hypothetical protein
VFRPRLSSLRPYLSRDSVDTRTVAHTPWGYRHDRVVCSGDRRRRRASVGS